MPTRTKKIKVCVATGSRAEFGLLRRLLNEIQDDVELDLKLLVTGMHLDQAYGYTYDEILAYGFQADAIVDIDLSDNSQEGVSKSTAQGIRGSSESLALLNPDVIVLLGDRFEIFSVAIAAMFRNLPIAHIHGGETTTGAIDEQIRHSITKMSSIHFVSTPEYRNRVIQLGEAPATVHCVGAPGVENILKMRALDQHVVEKRLGFQIRSGLILVTYHPVTLEDATAERQFKELLMALDECVDSNILITKANADVDGAKINQLADRYAALHPDRVIAVPSLGSTLYLSAMKLANVVVGNSSSGIIEAPSFGVPTVNIGDRQDGRIRADSVIDCVPDKTSIVEALQRSQSSTFQSLARCVRNPYEGTETAKTIKNTIKASSFRGSLKKQFYDLPLPSHV